MQRRSLVMAIHKGNYLHRWVSKRMFLNSSNLISQVIRSELIVMVGPPGGMNFRPTGPPSMIRPRMGVPGQPPSFRPSIGGIMPRPPTMPALNPIA